MFLSPVCKISRNPAKSRSKIKPLVHRLKGNPEQNDLITDYYNKELRDWHELSFITGVTSAMQMLMSGRIYQSVLKHATQKIKNLTPVLLSKIRYGIAKSTI
jgi:hypothetical protein